MKICENGIIREMTDEEIQKHNEQMRDAEEITTEQRIDALEAAMLEMAEVILNG